MYLSIFNQIPFSLSIFIEFKLDYFQLNVVSFTWDVTCPWTSIINRVDAILLIMLAIKSGMKVKSTQSVRHYINLKLSFPIITRNIVLHTSTPILPTSIPIEKQSFEANST